MYKIISMHMKFEWSETQDKQKKAQRAQTTAK